VLVITTPTGRVGRQVLARVLDTDTPVRVIARDPARLPADVLDRVDVVQGSHGDADVVDSAFAGADTVFWLVPPDPRAESVERHLVDFTAPAVDAVKRHGVRRVVGISSLGRGVARNAGHVTASLAMDDLIESSGVDYRALRMPGYMENVLQQVGPIKGQGMFFMTLSPDHRIPTVATRDVAAAAARLLTDDSWSGQGSVPVMGPEDLSPNDMAAIMSEVLDRPIRFQQIPEEGYKGTLLGFGMSEAWAQGLVDMAHAVEEGVYNAEPRTAESTTPTTFRQFCEEFLKPAVVS
jgi:uncharacterized protein YbjT (DUF2867 family)